MATEAAHSDRNTSLRSLTAESRSLYVLWLHFSRLNGASPQWVLDHMGFSPPVNPYVHADAARTALHAHPIHRWLTGKLPETMMAISALPLKGEFPLLWNFLSYLIQSVAQPKQPRGARTDRRRRTAGRNLHLVRGALRDGVISLPHKQSKVLEGLLATAHQELDGRRRRLVKHPNLLLIARELKLAGIITTALVLEVAALIDVDCDTRTAQRYVDLAGRVWGAKIPWVTSNWHILHALADDYRLSRPSK